MSDTLTARAARWCEAAGIPKPDGVREWCGEIDLHWDKVNVYAYCIAEDGSLYWEDFSLWGKRGMKSGSDSASLIAAIKEAME